MQSSNPYTLQPVKSRKPWLLSTALIGLASVGGALGLDVWMNGGTSSIIPAPVPSSTASTPAGPQNATGDPIRYVYGMIQVSVTRNNGAITAVDLIQATASAGRSQAFPTLQQNAVTANGVNFGNVSGATYTTDAFKKALNSAISKLP